MKIETRSSLCCTWSDFQLRKTRHSESFTSHSRRRARQKLCMDSSSYRVFQFIEPNKIYDKRHSFDTTSTQHSALLVLLLLLHYLISQACPVACSSGMQQMKSFQIATKNHDGGSKEDVSSSSLSLSGGRPDAFSLYSKMDRLLFRTTRVVLLNNPK